MIAKVMSYTVRTAAAALLSLLGILTLTDISPIYDFETGDPFSGPDIYNPYALLDTSDGWVRTNLHTHTHATKWLNECELYPDSVARYYDRLGYDLESFSNHMELTEDPAGTSGQIWVYEHGYNLAKHHNLVFGARKVNYFDLFMPVTVSQKQFKMDMLLKDADFIFFNHPDRTNFTGESDMALLSGYRLIEADCGFRDKDTYCRKWDIALSNGHYVPSAISDDLHEPEKTDRIARRCTYIDSPTENYEDIKESLLAGRCYTAHIPDFGNGDWDEKIRANHDLPTILDIGLRDENETFMILSRPASRIEVIGQEGELVKTVSDTASVDYRFSESDSYIRLVARFDDGTVLMSNPFARWDSSSTASGTPYRDYSHRIDWMRTVPFNLIVILIAALLFRLAASIMRKPYLMN